MSQCTDYLRFPQNEETESVDSFREEGRKYHQYQAAIIAGLAATAVGTTDGWLLVAETKKMESFPIMILQHKKLLIFTMNIAAFLGALLAGYLVNSIGRKRTLLLAGLLMIPVWCLYSLQHDSISLVCLGTAFGGFSTGIVSVGVPLYISELAEVSVRGTLGMLFYLQFTVGELFTSLQGSDETLYTVAGTCILVVTIFLTTFAWMPETPYYLVADGRMNEARYSIQFFRGQGYEIEDEIDHLKDAVSKETTFRAMFKEPKVKMNILGCIILMVLCRMIAFDGFNYRLYKVMISIVTSGGGYTILILILQIIGTGGAAYFVEKYGRRKLLLTSTSIMATCFFLSFVFDFTSYAAGRSIPTILIIMAFYVAGQSIGVGPIPWLSVSDMIPSQYKAQCTTLLSCVFWFMVLTSEIRSEIYYKIGYDLFFIFLCILYGLLFTFIIKILPETKGRDSNVVNFPTLPNRGISSLSEANLRII